MVITTTAVGFSLSGLGLAFCGFWFFKAFQKIGGLRSGNQIGILLSTFFLGLALQHFILAIGGFAFITNTEALYAVLVIDAIVLAIVTALGIYLFFYILLPNFSSKWAAIVTMFYGLFVTTLIIFTHLRPFLTTSQAIDWNMSRLTSLSLYYLLLLNIGAPFLIFVKNLFYATTRDVKLISIIIASATFAGLINVSIGFLSFLDSSADLRGFIFDRILGIIGILFIIGFFIIPLWYGWVSKKSYGK